jgi:hypothetical protein
MCSYRLSYGSVACRNFAYYAEIIEDVHPPLSSDMICILLWMGMHAKH